MKKFFLKLEIRNPADFSDNENSSEIITKIIKYILDKKIEFFDDTFNVDYSVKYNNKKDNFLTLGFLTFEISLTSLKSECTLDREYMLGILTNSYLEHGDIKFMVKDFILNLLMCVNITYPGIFLIENIYLKHNRKIIYTFENMNSNSMMDLYSEFSIQNWIKLEEINLEETWKWLKNKTSFFNGKKLNNIDKSLNAFSYVFGAENYEELFYSLMAIEALYNTNRNITVESQIKTKLFKIFGETKEMRKKINEMYEKRSRVIHGNINIPKKNYANFDNEETFIEFFEKDFLPTIVTAEMIYIATLHLFVKNDSSVFIEDFSINFG